MMFLLDELDEVIHDSVVKVLSSQMCVTACGHHLKDPVVNGQDGHIKGATTQVKHQDVVLAALLVKAIGNSCCCGFVDDTLHSQTSNDSSILGGLPLSIVEVCRNSDHSMLHRLAQVGLCSTAFSVAMYCCRS